MTIGLSTTVRTNRMTQILNAIDGGSGAGKLKFYDGTRPATGGTATTLLGTVTCSDPCGTVSSGVLTFSAFTQDSSADATGTATWARFTDSDDTFVADVSVGASGTEIVMNTTSIVSGGPISISSGSLTEGNA